MTQTLRFALLGTGFWSYFQLAGWREIGGVECVALYNRTPEKARDLARSFGLAANVYAEPDVLLREEKLDFVDIVTSAETHSRLVHMAAEHNAPVICQKPMAESWAEVKGMVDVCRCRNLPFFVHENWRWQSPIRKLKEILSRPEIGRVYRARIRIASAFPVFDNQPFLKTLERFLLMDMGSHIFDVTRFLFGEPQSVYCTIARVREDIRGEDVATVLLRTAGGAIIICEMAYAGTPMEHDYFPQTFAYIECDNASVHLGPQYCLHVTTNRGTEVIQAPPPRFAWADPAYEVVHASIVSCHRDLLAGLRGEREPETTAEDNLRTMRLVFSAYESAESNQVIHL